MKLVHGNNFQTKCVQCGKDIVPELTPFCSKQCGKQWRGRPI